MNLTTFLILFIQLKVLLINSLELKPIVNYYDTLTSSGDYFLMSSDFIYQIYNSTQHMIQTGNTMTFTSLQKLKHRGSMLMLHLNNKDFISVPDLDFSQYKTFPEIAAVMEFLTMNETEFVISCQGKSLNFYQFQYQTNTMSTLLNKITLAITSDIKEVSCESYREKVYCLVDSMGYTFQYVIIDSTYLQFTQISSTQITLKSGVTTSKPLLRKVIDNTIIALCGKTAEYITCQFKNRTSSVQIGTINSDFRDCAPNSFKSIVDWKPNILLFGCSDTSGNNWFFEMSYTGVGFVQNPKINWKQGTMEFMKMSSDIFVVLLNRGSSTKPSYFYYFYTPICEDMEVRVASANDLGFLLRKPLNNFDTEYIVFPALITPTTFGNLYDDANKVIVINKQYNSSKTFTFKPTNSKGMVTLNFKVQLENNIWNDMESSCKITFDVRCFESCKTCTGIEEYQDNKCVLCNTGYYKYLDNTGPNCYNESTKLNYYWYMNPDDSLYYHCSKSCDGCTANEEKQLIDGLTKYNTHCKACAADYYPYKPPKQCRNEGLKEENIYFDPLDEVYYDCHPNCKSCTSINNTLTMNCLSCIDTKSMDGLKQNCISLTPPGDDYYKGQYDDYYKCYEKCDKCNKSGTIEEHNCLGCLSPNYLLRAFGLCITKAEAQRDYPDYYIDEADRELKACYLSCKTCDGNGSPTQHFCLSCKKYYYMVIGKGNCFSTLEQPDGYFLNEATPKQWEECDASCKTCSKKTVCDSCKTKENLYQGLCAATCPPSTSIYNGLCVVTSPPGSTLVKDECFYMILSSDGIMTSNLPKEELIKIFETNLPQFPSGNDIFKGNGYYIQIYDKTIEDDSKGKAKEYSLTTCTPDLCLYQLSTYYNLNEEDIIIMKIDLNITGSPTNDVEFRFYNKLNERLDDLTICNDVDVPVVFPILKPGGLNISLAEGMIKQGFDCFKAEDPFFNDFCTPFTANNGLDVSLQRRREDFFQNITFCQQQCIYDSVNVIDLTATCNCKTSILPGTSFTQPPNDFTSEVHSDNLFIIFCYNLAFNGKIILKNIGFYVLSVFILAKISLLIYIAVKGFYLFTLWLKLPMACPPTKNNKIETKNINIVKKKHKTPSIDFEVANINRILNRPVAPIDIEVPDTDKEFEHNNYQTKNYNGINMNYNNRDNGMEIDGMEGNNNNYDNEIGNQQDTNQNEPLSQINNKLLGSNQTNNGLLTKAQLEKALMIIKEDDDDLSTVGFAIFQYKEELSQPLMNICRIYYSFIKMKHPIFNTFIYPIRYEFFIFNILLFFNSIAIQFGLNALLFTMAHIDEKYDSNGTFNFFSILPKSIFASLGAFAYGFILSLFISPSREVKTFILREYAKARKRRRMEYLLKKKKSPIHTLNNNSNNEEQLILKINSYKNNIKEEPSSRVVIENIMNNHTDTDMINLKPLSIIQEEFDHNVKRIIRKSKVKLIIFTVINSLVMLFLWYLVICFCALYQNSQGDCIIGTMFSIAMSMLMPFIIAFVFSLLKWIALKWHYETLYVINEHIHIIL